MEAALDLLIAVIIAILILAVCFSFGKAVEHAVRNIWDVATRDHHCEED